MSRIMRNVVEVLWVVHVKIGGSKYQFRVKAESEEQAKAKASAMAADRFNASEGKTEIVGIDRIDPEDFVD